MLKSIYKKKVFSNESGAGAGPDKNLFKFCRHRVNKSKGSAGFNPLRATLIKLLNFIGDGKILEPFRPFFFCARKLSPSLRIFITNQLNALETMPSLSDKKILKLQIGCGNKRGTEKTAHSFRNLIGQYYNPERAVFCLINRPNNAFNYLNRETTLNQVFFFKFNRVVQIHSLRVQ